MLKALWTDYTLNFRFTARTSRESMTEKKTYFVKLFDDSRPDVVGYGECALFRGLSADDVPDFERILAETCRHPEEPLPKMSAIRFGFESARAALANGGGFNPWPGAWSEGRDKIVINGLIWMGDRDTMLARIDEKLAAGFRVLKLKIGGIDFESECGLLEYIRSYFPADKLEIRLDANGSFTSANALERLDRLSRFNIHSIEQPVKAGQPSVMADICRQSPIDIALDEELIGCRDELASAKLLDEISPRYIILKPTLCGGFEAADQWIRLAVERGIGWWATSALESDIGLNAIAQWVSQYRPAMPQGLGTGQLFINNIPSPLTLRGDCLMTTPEAKWDISALEWRQ